MYYRGAQAAIVVYDIQNQDSFQRAKTWVKELHKQVSVSSSAFNIKVNAISRREFRYLLNECEISLLLCPHWAH